MRLRYTCVHQNFRAETRRVELERCVYVSVTGLVMHDVIPDAGNASKKVEKWV